MAQGMVPDHAGCVATDTRADLNGAWFVALTGKTFDGHDFIGDAFCSGALGCIVEDRGSYPIASTSFPLIAVDDTEEALACLVANWRKRVRKKITLVTPASSHLPTAFALSESAMLVEGGQVMLPDDASGLDCFYVDWRKNISEILCAFLNIPDEQTQIVADFAPRPLSRAPWLVEVLKPDLLVLTAEGYQYDRLSGEHGEPASVMRELVGAIEKISPLNRDFQFGKNLQGGGQISGAPEGANVNETRGKQLSDGSEIVPPAARLSTRRYPMAVATDQELASALGLKFICGPEDELVRQQLGLN